MKTRLQRIWGNMKDRCTNPNNPSYHRYGGRGISYWCSWDNFNVFMYWALTNGYEEHLTLERVDNDGDYTHLIVGGLHEKSKVEILQIIGGCIIWERIYLLPK